MGVEKLLQENVLPHIFFGKSKSLSPIVGNLSKILGKKDGLGLQHPVTSVNKLFPNLQRASMDLTRSMMRES